MVLQSLSQNKEHIKISYPKLVGEGELHLVEQVFEAPLGTAQFAVASFAVGYLENFLKPMSEPSEQLDQLIAEARAKCDAFQEMWKKRDEAQAEESSDASASSEANA